MVMKRIGFSHDYQKLWGQTKARLLEVKVVDRKDIHNDAIDYDTEYYDDALQRHLFRLEEGVYLRLTLIGDRGIPFTTYRTYKPENIEKYAFSVGEEFEIFVVYENVK